MRLTPRSRGLRRVRRAAGMTIIEMMIALAVVGLISVVGYMGVRHVRKSALREQTIEVAAMLRNAYNMSAQTGKHHRVIFDLDEQTIRMESCEGEMRLRRSQREAMGQKQTEPVTLQQLAAERGIPPEMLEAANPAEAQKMAEAITGKQLGGAECQPPLLPSGDADGRGHERGVRTDRGIRIKRIFAQHLEGPATDGTVTINFFPLGYAEKAIVEVADDEGSMFTLLVHGLTGRVEFRDGELRDPNDHMMRDGAGDRQEER